MDIEIDIKWNDLVRQLESRFGGELDLDGILFLIGIQELGHGYRKFNKDQKVDVMHIAICTILSPYGYYEFKGIDKDLWPHWEVTEKLPHLKGDQQEILIKKAVIEYFDEREIALP